MDRRPMRARVLLALAGMLVALARRQGDGALVGQITQWLGGW
jgi:hypothetical protein